MINQLFQKRLYIPIAAYIALIATILILTFLIPWPYVISVSAVLMLGIPFYLKGGVSYFKWNFRGLVIGLAVSVVILSLYIAVIWGYGYFTGNSVVLRHLSYSFILMQLFLVAIPEEVFFRGYLQRTFGQGIKSIIVVSILFAIGHFITLCLLGTHNIAVCAQSILTFFPSLVMGYLYLRTANIWASVIFHFLANIVHIGAGLSLACTV